MCVKLLHLKVKAKSHKQVNNDGEEKSPQQKNYSTQIRFVL